VELRRHHRVPFSEPVVFARKGSESRVSGQSHDISIGGMFIQTQSPAPFGAEVVIHLHVPGEASAFALPAIVRWTEPGGMGVQFQPLGARETHSITELVAEHDEND
jgi:Tfp pilus assembly protein PilZ